MITPPKWFKPFVIYLSGKIYKSNGRPLIFLNYSHADQYGIRNKLVNFKVEEYPIEKCTEMVNQSILKRKEKKRSV